MSVKLITWLSTFVLIILCELGDKTQLAVLLMTSNNPSRRWLVFASGALALTLCVVVEVTVGALLAQYLGPAIINKATGVVFLAVGVFILIQHFRVLERQRIKEAAQARDISVL